VSMKGRFSYLLLVAFLLLVDQGTKEAVARSLPVGGSKVVVPGFLQVVHVHNRGAIFGFFSRTGSPVVTILMTLASLVALALVLVYFFRTTPSERFVQLSLSLILAGALGNLSDRLFRGYVIDFLDFSVKGWHWPSFNAADSCITVGALFLVGTMMFKRSS